MSSLGVSALAGTFFLFSSVALANPFNVYGAGTRGASLGGAMTAGTDDPFATFYNPAGLAFAEHGLLQLQFVSFNPTLEIDRIDPDTDPNIDTFIPDSDFGLNIGVSLPLSSKFAMGLALFLPSGTKLLTAQSLEPQAPQFYMYQSLHKRFELIPGFAFRPIPELSIGAGVQISTKVSANFDSTILGLDPNTGDVLIQRDLIADADVLASAIVGVTLQPIEQLRLGFAYRQKNDGQIALDALVDTGQQDIADLLLTLDTTAFFVPDQISFGASFAAAPQLNVFATMDLDLWSQAKNPETIVGTVISLNGEEVLSIDTQEVALNFKNVFVPRVGMEVIPHESVRLRGGYFYRPTHIPPQNGPDSNFLDNDVHGVSFGGMYQVANPGTAAKLPLQIEAAYQLQAMLPGAVGKVDPNDPIGNMGFGGAVHSIFVSVGQQF